MLINTVQPTFIISGISFDDIYKKYLDGHYNDMTLDGIKSNRPKIQSKFKKKEFVSDNENKEKYVVTDNRGIKISFVNVTNPTNICQWCRRTITEDKMSIPIQIHKTPDNTDTVFNGHGTYCTFECAYADLNRTYKRNIIFRDSSTYLNFIFSRLHPSKVLKQAPDFVLHQCNGGPLTDEEFHSETNKYYNIGRYKINDTTTTYITR